MNGTGTALNFDSGQLDDECTDFFFVCCEFDDVDGSRSYAWVNKELGPVDRYFQLELQAM